MRIGTTAASASALLVSVSAAASLAQLAPCPEKAPCVEIAVGSPAEPSFRGGVVRIPIAVAPAGDDGGPGGLDAIAAVSMSVSIPGLALADCAEPDQNGLNATFEIPSHIAQQFLVFVEITSCANRDTCLCPDAGQARDEYVNIAITGPGKVVPGPKPGGIPTLPPGELLALSLRVADDAPEELRVHVFSETDDPKSMPKPEFAGFVTLGDDQAVDVTADRAGGTSNVRVLDGTILVSTDITATPEPTTPAPTVSPDVTPTRSETPGGETPTGGPTTSPSPDDTPAAVCPGDCSDDRGVSIDELIRGVTIALGRAPLESCRAADLDDDGLVRIDEMVRAVNAGLFGCGG